MSPARIISLLALLAAVGCNNNTGSAISYAFNRPERLDFACLGQYATVGQDLALNGTWKVLPRQCCTAYEPSNFSLSGMSDPDQQVAAGTTCFGTAEQPLQPALHALVTQSARGEVAAVDLRANRVLDSDRQVPGFTFLDTGGLPTAIVVPPHQPNGSENDGPTFFYIASAEDQSVRAIPTCRFRGGARCGPDREGPNVNDPAYPSRLRVPLPGAPHDMILGPDQALWVSVPRALLADGTETGVIMRVELPTTTANVDAFALDPTTRLPTAQWHGVPAMEDAPMDEPVIDDVDYRTSCGLGVGYASTSFTLPLAPRADVSPTPEPTRLRYDEESGLLLAGDRTSPGVHVFRLREDGVLTALGALRTGQPLREFALTRPVPATAVSGRALLDLTAQPENEAAETKRYLYGIDDSEGTVAVFDFAESADDGLPTLTPLLAPVPDLDLMRYADRIALPAPAQTLEIIDTRPQSGYVCGEESIAALRDRRSVLNGMTRPLSAEATRELQRVNARIAIFDNAAADNMRGVFLTVVSVAGQLSMVDVHDLDNSCRAQKYCCDASGSGSDPNGVPLSCTADANEQRWNVPRSSDAQESLLVRRHTRRRRAAGPQIAEVGTASLLRTQVCDATDPHASVQLGQVCTPADSYTQLTENWNIDWHGTLPNSRMSYAHWEPAAGLQLNLIAPLGFDTCARGVEVGDLVAVGGLAPEGLRGQCPDPTAESAPQFRVLEARRDRLLVEPFVSTIMGETAEARLARQQSIRDRAVTCYPDFVDVELRAGGFLVIGQNGTYLHRVVAGPDGVCVDDPAQDDLLNARVRPGTIIPSVGAAPVPAEVFQNPFVRFALAPVTDGVDPETRQTTVSVTRASVPFFVNAVTAGDSVTDALPSTLQYLPEAGNLFLLDSKGQGLRRYTLRPFERENTVFR
ncbi:MAG: hypothetical protein ABW352_11680 [Polyangiales bacterium]